MKTFKKIVVMLIVILGILAIAFATMLKLGVFNKDKPKKLSNGKLDDWMYEQKFTSDTFSNSGIQMSATESFDSAKSNNLGFSTGGAKDINNFRENIDKGYFPLNSDITYEGIYYDYNFETGNSGKENTEDLFYPSYSTAISKDPISDEEEYYLSVGLNSNIKQSDFKRKNLNLVIALDISGSMESSIDNYYYDLENEEDEEFKSKMKLAEESINILIDRLNPEDSFGMVLFDNDSYRAKPLNLVNDVDMEVIKEHILDIKAIGGTNFEAGYEEATEVFEEYGIKDTEEYENRIIVITDAMPNLGTTSSSGLLKSINDNSKNGINTTFIGVGVDFNTELIKKITNVRGANYYSVSSNEEFEKRMGEEFDYMVTPLVYDLNMDFESDYYEISAVYGTDDIDSENGNIMHVNTLFPSASNSDGEVKGGLVLLKLKKINDTEDSEIKLNVSYETRDGKKSNNTQNIKFEVDENEKYDNTGIRKGIVLARYVNVIKDWISYERSDDDRFLITPSIGIIDWYDTNIKDDDEDYPYYSNENERTSVKLTVSDEYKEVFKIIKEYMEAEIKELDDDTMEQEIDILDKLLK